ncbi:transcriptional repressor ILP1 [Pelomyxa schiedti]|nr:transcriptional repressor ILP1 [Pelomyxa schiedti]
MKRTFRRKQQHSADDDNVTPVPPESAPGTQTPVLPDLAQQQQAQVPSNVTPTPSVPTTEVSVSSVTSTTHATHTHSKRKGISRAAIAVSSSSPPSGAATTGTTASTTITTTKTLLSFGEDEEPTPQFHTKPIQLVKKNPRKLSRDTSAATPSTATRAFGSDTGQYTPDKLADLRRNSTTIKAPTPEAAHTLQSTITVQTSTSPGIASTPGSIPVTLHQLPASTPVVSSVIPLSETAAELTGEDAISFMDNDGNGDVQLTEEQQQAVKAKKMHMMNAIPSKSPSAQPDFIPLDSRLAPKIGTHMAPQQQHSNRIKFADPGRDTTKVVLEPSSLTGGVVGDDDDDEVQLWVNEQIKKGCVNKGELAKLKETVKEKPLKQVQPIPFGALLLKPIPKISAEEFTVKLEAELKLSSETYSSQQSQMKQINTEIDECNKNLKDIAESLQKATTQSHMFIGIKEYLKNLLDLFAEKAPQIESLEERVMQIEAQRSLTRLQASELQLSLELKVALGGVDIETVEPVTRTRFQKRSSRSESLGGADFSDSEDESALKNYNSTFDAINQEADRLFEDVEDDYRAISQIKAVFEEWKKNDPYSYRQAYVSLSVPSLFSPLVRFEMLQWDPLFNISFDNYEWYKVLLDYGVGDKEINPDDMDLSLVPTLVEKVVIPREIFTDVLVSMHGAADRAPKLPKSPAEPNTPAYKSCMRLVWRITRLICNVVSWHELLDTSSVQRLAFDNILNMKLLPHLKTLSAPKDALLVCEHIVNSVPPSWLPDHKVLSNSSPTTASAPAPSFLLLLADFVRIHLSMALAPSTRGAPNTNLTNLLQKLYG